MPIHVNGSMLFPTVYCGLFYCLLMSCVCVHIVIVSYCKVGSTFHRRVTFSICHRPASCLKVIFSSMRFCDTPHRSWFSCVQISVAAFKQTVQSRAHAATEVDAKGGAVNQETRKQLQVASISTCLKTTSQSPHFDPLLPNFAAQEKARLCTPN